MSGPSLSSTFPGSSSSSPTYIYNYIYDYVCRFYIYVAERINGIATGAFLHHRRYSRKGIEFQVVLFLTFRFASLYASRRN